MKNEHGEIGANLKLNLEVAPLHIEEATVKKAEEKKLFVEFVVASHEALRVKFLKDERHIVDETTESSKYTITKKVKAFL